MKRFLIITLYAVTGTLSAQYLQPTTVQVAAQVNFPVTLNELRDKVHTFLDQQKVGMMVDVQDLRTRNLMYRAANLEYLNRLASDQMSARFDREFEGIDRKFFSGADRLDRQEATILVKSHFVNTLRAEAVISINALIDSFSSPENKG